MTKPYLLMTNDDGIHAPGLRHLWETVKDHANTTIIAPHQEKSGAGLSITWRKPLHIRPTHWDGESKAFSLNGTPADCVKMALAVLLERVPDMIISGINKGSNSGRTVLYSGTVGGVIEGVLKGIPGIAFSFSDLEDPPVSITEKYIFPIIQYFLLNPIPPGTLLNVNFPYNCQEKILGVRVARQGKSYWREAPDRRLHPEGAPYYWLGGTWGSMEEEPLSDVSLLDQGFITITPIQISELTCNKTFDRFKNFNESDLYKNIN